MSFNPLENKNEASRAKFWDRYSEKFVSIENARSTKSYLQGELALVKKFLTPRTKTGRLLKLDLWNEAHHTAIMSHLHDLYDEVYAIDISPDVVKRALDNLQKKGIKINGSVMDMRAMDFPDNYFDYVYTMGTIEHIPDPTVALREIYRVLKPGGRAVVGVPYKYEWFGKSIALDIFAYLGIKEDGREYSYGWTELTRQLETSGFKIIARTGTYFMPWFIRAVDWFLAQRLPRLAWISYPFILISDLLSNFEFFKRHGSLLAPVVEKPKNISWQKGRELAVKYNTPLFVTDKNLILENISKFRKVFSAYQGGFTLCYSSKTNSQLEILRTMREEKVVAEVCSLLDLKSALAAGYLGPEIIFEGLTKTDEEIELAITSEVRIINIESYDEAVRIEKIAQKHNRKVDVGIRLSFPSVTGIKSLLGVTYDRFGTSVKNGEALRIANFIVNSKQLNLVGLHCHTGSNQSSSKKYLIGIDVVLAFMKVLKDKYDLSISLINLGGGIGLQRVKFYSIKDLGINFIKNILGLHINYATYSSFDFDKLSSEIITHLDRKLSDHQLSRPQLMLEPGRALVGDTTDLVLKVINTKQTDINDWIILDGGTNLLPVLTLFSEYHDIDVVSNNTKLKKVSIAGPLLYSADVLAANRLLPKADIGDLVIIRDVGAYCVCQSNHFLYPRAATVLIDGGKETVIERRETIEDVLMRNVVVKQDHEQD